jgi:hypothetical protein
MQISLSGQHRGGVINQHTLEKICRREPVRTIKLAECLKVLKEYEKRLFPKAQHNQPNGSRLSPGRHDPEMGLIVRA